MQGYFIYRFPSY